MFSARINVSNCAPHRSGGDTSPELNRASYPREAESGAGCGPRPPTPPSLAEAGLRVVAEDKVPRHVPYSVKSFGPPSSSALRTGLDLEEKDTTSPSKLADTERATTLATHPHIRPPLPLSPSLSPTDLRTIEGATSKMFGHFVGMRSKGIA
ncbi:hypothetical protein K525DRAFT_245738 [Schizophyllum commune Loenen D]|nr:hypothetical protein K525DRAFT_245738 [Schizophyllum commune Loenen D]